MCQRLLETIPQAKNLSFRQLGCLLHWYNGVLLTRPHHFKYTQIEKSGQAKRSRQKSFSLTLKLILIRSSIHCVCVCVCLCMSVCIVWLIVHQVMIHQAPQCTSWAKRQGLSLPKVCCHGVKGHYKVSANCKSQVFRVGMIRPSSFCFLFLGVLKSNISIQTIIV